MCKPENSVAMSHTMSQKIVCKQADCHLHPNWAESTGGNARGNKQEEKADGNKRSGEISTLSI